LSVTGPAYPELGITALRRLKVDLTFLCKRLNTASGSDVAADNCDSDIGVELFDVLGHSFQLGRLARGKDDITSTNFGIRITYMKNYENLYTSLFAPCKVSVEKGNESTEAWNMSSEIVFVFGFLRERHTKQRLRVC
jgi:hypothetical protein